MTSLIGEETDNPDKGEEERKVFVGGAVSDNKKGGGEEESLAEHCRAGGKAVSGPSKLLRVFRLSVKFRLMEKLKRDGREKA